MSESMFLRDVDYYERDLSPIAEYIRQSAFFLMKMTGMAFEAAKAIIIERMRSKTGSFANLRDPVVQHFERKENGDSEVAYKKLTEYLAEVKRRNLILVPTGTAYLPPEVMRSPLSQFMEVNKRKRSKAKKASQAAKAAGDMVGFEMKDNEQQNAKTFNNATSGTFATKGSPLHNPTAHNTLTSITRSVSSVGNATNEKLLGGNRHYRNSTITLNNIVSIASDIDSEGIRAAIQMFGMCYPTVDQTMECIKYSTDLYWHDNRQLAKIRRFVETLTDVERAGVVYIGDLYHIRKFNPEVVRTLLLRLSHRDRTKTYPRDVAMNIMRQGDEQIVNFVHQACMSAARGIGKDYTKLSDENLFLMASMVENATQVVSDYKTFFQSFFLTRHMPVSAAYIPNMIRRVVVLSDTDSTMFSCDEFVQWQFGDVVFNDDSFAFSGAVAYIATQCIGHGLAVLSGNMGVERDKKFLLAMKPEFLFGLHCQTSVAKHYFSAVMVKEGNVYKEIEPEIKGVHLKSSASPRSIIEPAQAMMQEIMTRILSNEKIAIYDIIERVIGVEKMIRDSVLNSGTEFFKQIKIKPADAYSDGPDRSPYKHHVDWQNIWAPSYQLMPEPTYSCIKIPTVLNNRTSILMWLERIEDDGLRKRLGAWVLEKKKTSINTLYMSYDFVVGFGIPKEVLPIIDWRRIVLDLTNIYRMILETLGFFPKKGMLLMEMYPEGLIEQPQAA